MKPSEAVRPISYLKAHAAAIVRDVGESRRTFVITRNGQAKAVVQDVRTYEEIQDSLALLRMLAQSRRSVAAGRVKRLGDAARAVRARVRRG